MDKEDVFLSTTEYYLKIKKDKVEPFLGQWMDLETTILIKYKSDTQVQLLHFRAGVRNWKCR